MSGAPGGSDPLPPASDTPIEPTGSGLAAPMVGHAEDTDGPGFTPARRGTANWIIVGVAVVVLASAIALVFR